MMRITGGRARGRVLRAPVGPGVRPTSARVREALFSMVGQDLTGQRVLDAFGGSGLLGLEAWSRGADVTIVEKRPRTARTIRETAQGLGAEVTVVVGDVTKRMGALGTFDGVVADPPYAVDPASCFSTLWDAARGWLVFETEARTPMPADPSDARVRHRTFGGTALHIYVRELA